MKWNERSSTDEISIIEPAFRVYCVDRPCHHISLVRPVDYFFFPTVPLATGAFFGLLAPYLERDVLRPATPCKS